MRPDLWRAHSNKQVYIVGFLTEVLGHGPAVVRRRMSQTYTTSAVLSVEITLYRCGGIPRQPNQT